MKYSPLAKLLCSGLLLLLSGLNGQASVLFEQNFEGLENGKISGQAGWTTPAGGDSLALVVEDAQIAHSPSKYLKLVGQTGSMVDLRARNLSPGATLSDTTDNHFQFYFRPDNASTEPGNKAHLNIILYGNQGAERILEAQIQFAVSRIALTNNASRDSFNTTLSLSAPLQEGNWYLFDLVMTPSTSSYKLTITDAETSGELLSGTYLFQTTSVPITRVLGFDLKTNANGRLDWYVDDISITSIPEPASLLSLSLAALGLLLWKTKDS